MTTPTPVAGLAEEAVGLIAAEDPLDDALEGCPETLGRLADPSWQAQEALAGEAARLAERAARAPVADAAEEVTRAVVVQQARAVADRLGTRLVEHTVADYQNSPLGRLLGSLPAVRPADEEQERGHLERLAAVPEYLAKAAERHREGLRAGRLPVAERVRTAVARLDAYLADPAGDPLRAVPLRTRHHAERDRLVDERVRPAFAAYREALRTDLASPGRSPERPGLCHLPDGEEHYATLARVHTTTGRSPKELHDTGVALLAHIEREYVPVGAQAFGGAPTPAEVRERLRTDTRLRWSGAQEMLGAARTAIARAELAAPRRFGRLPALPCALEGTEAPGAPLAWYMPAALDGSRPGTYHANTDRPTERSRVLAEATAFHEAVPGHHVQLSLAQELTGLPRLRRIAWINAYIEGWGLYAERLADEMGLYSGPLARLGMLAMDSLRAARLVVDTGLHHFGWTREQAAAYLREHTVLSETEIQNETDRYIEWPGQALSYMTGRLEIQRLRTRAARELGPAFDIRAFHDLVLGGGALPLDVLDQVVARWTRRG
ncbi:MULTISPECIES: DUF885 domain-containing protein [Streptomyces]|uniref:DUF885 domain-containing protein n=1 Tax=Streptomyces canarius TaxID=285453 RepID=A0ABQ3D737_9ACTN|nr:DUF885 domain-containing protein [Streptomyces canarius]GHA62156.1 hypothetical protein GCM10010345_77820 [Streptomyces canarius]